MPSTPQSTAQYAWGPANITGDTFHFYNSSNVIVSWIDANGYAWGNLASGSNFVAALNATAQTGSISTTTLYAVGASSSGMYRVNVDMLCTTAGTGGQVTATIAWNNGVTLASLTTGTALPLNQQGELFAQDGTFYSAGGQNITFSTSATGITGSPQYALRIRLEYLG